MAGQVKKQDEKVRQLFEKLEKQAKEQGLPSAMHLMAKQDPAMGEIFARMIKAEMDRKEPMPGCDLCTTVSEQ